MRTLLTTPLGWALLLGLAGLVLLVLPFRWRGTWRRGVPGAPLLLLAAWLLPLVAATPFVAERVAGPLLREARASPPPAWAAAQAPEAIVVLGAGLDGPRLPGALLGREAGRRLLQGVVAARRWPGARLVFSGGARSTRALSSAMRMAEEARALGVGEGRIVVENQARSTRQNALHVAGWLRERGLTRVALVTSSVHMPRALGAFSAEGVDALPLPAGPPLGRTPLREAFRPDATALVDTTIALHEHLGRAYYRSRGWVEEPDAVR